MKLYLAGPMSGIEDHNFPLFHKAAKWLREIEGHEIINPAELNQHDPNLEVTPELYAQFMRKNIKALMTCEGIALLPNWYNSKGATCEATIAQVLNMKILFLEFAPFSLSFKIT